MNRDVGALEDAFAPRLSRNLVKHRDGLAAQGQQGWSLKTLKRGRECSGRFLGVGGADDIEIGNHAKTGDGFHGLMGRTVLPHPDRVIRVDVDDGEA